MSSSIRQVQTAEQLNSDLGLRILLVEDNIDIREALQVVLESEGYAVTGAGSAEEGLELLERERFHLVLSDYSLPGESGTWMLNSARERGLLRQTAQLLITAHPEPKETRGVPVLHKPLDVDDFLRVVHEVLTPARSAAFEQTRQRFEGGAAMDVAPQIELTLYVSSHSPASLRATRNLQKLLQRYKPGTVKLTVRDLAREPHSVAEEDRVAFTPTLVKRSPQPKAWVLGDLENLQIVIDLLENAGAEPTP